MIHYSKLTLKLGIAIRTIDSIFALGLTCLFWIAFFFPESFWGIHFTAFIPPLLSYSILILSTTIVLLSFGREFKLFKRSIKNLAINWNVCSVLIIAISGVLFYYFPIVNDYYGNARSFSGELNKQVQSFSLDSFLQLFYFNLEPGQGRNSVRILVNAISYLFNLNIRQSFYLLNISSGILYTGLLLKSLSLTIPNIKSRIILSLSFLTSALFLNFFGHIETYSPVLLTLICFLFLVKKNTLNPKKYKAVLLALLWLIGLRFHSFFILLGPLLLISFLHQFFPHFSKKHLSLKKLLIGLFIPILLVSVYAYFFVFEDYHDPRALQNFQDIDRLFLPIISPAPPLDQYNLFSINHISDFLNILLFWSPAVIYLLFKVIQLRKKINWNSPLLSGYMISLFIFLCFLFAVNPLLTMPMDWDLFMIPLSLVFFLIMEVFSMKSIIFTNREKMILLALILLSIPTFLSTLSKKSNGERILSVGKWVYKTYYEHSSTYILFGLKESGSIDSYIEREEKVIEDLKPFALLKNDKQYADLLIDHAIAYYYLENKDQKARALFLKSLNYFPLNPKFYEIIDEVNSEFLLNNSLVSDQNKKEAEILLANARKLKKENQFKLALAELKKASFYDPSNIVIYIERMELFYQMKKYDEAYREALILAKYNHFESEKMSRILIHLSLEAENYEQALKHCKARLQEFPEDSLALEIASRIENEDQVDKLKLKFRSNF